MINAVAAVILIFVVLLMTSVGIVIVSIALDKLMYAKTRADMMEKVINNMSIPEIQDELDLRLKDLTKRGI